jgi:amidophosphoribosyltransferase
MADSFKDECGVFGIFNHEEAARLSYLGLYALQHRGQESAGMVSSDGERLHQVRGMGYVSEIFGQDQMSRLPGLAVIGHVRYSTAGTVSLREAQPFLVDGYRGQIALCHNGNLPYASETRAELELSGAIFSSTSDSEIVLHKIARSRSADLVGAMVDTFTEIAGAYSMLFLTKDKLIAVRDPRGFRPLCLGQLGDAYVVASETCAFDLIEATYLRDVQPGEILVIDSEGLHSSFPLAKERPAHCIFEHVYFSRPDSIVFGRSVNKSRHKMGQQLAREHPADADIVVPVPDSGTAAAIGYASESGLKFRFGLVRNHYVGRTFIEPKQAIRHFGVRVKLNPVRDLIENLRVVLIDDSIVRGTTSKKIVQMVRQAGAREVHVRISCPPTIAPCFFGVDTPTREELIGANLSVPEIAKFIDADSLGYLSLGGLRRACGDPRGTRHCTACYTNDYPITVTSGARTKTEREEGALTRDSVWPRT